MAYYTRGMLLPLEGGGMPVIFQYNPFELNIGKGAHWAQLPTAGRDQPYLQFGCGTPRKVQMNMEVSRGNNGPEYVKVMCEAVEALTKPTVRGAGLDRPPIVQLILGAHLSLSCIVHNAQTRFGSHRGQRAQTYMAEPYGLLPKEAVINIVLLEFT